MGGAAAAMVAVGAAKAGFGVVQGIEAAKLSRQNASVYESNIPYVRAAAAERARQLQVGSYLAQGQQRTGYAGAGLAVGGSVFDVMSDTITNYDRDTSFALLEGQLQVRNLQRQADLERYKARTSIRDSIVGGILGTAGTAAYASSIGRGGGNPSTTLPVQDSIFGNLLPLRGIGPMGQATRLGIGGGYGSSF